MASAVSPTRAIQSDCSDALLKLRPSTRRRRDEEVDTRAASVIKKERAVANKQARLEFKGQCTKTDAIKAQDELVLELSAAIAKFTGLWAQYPNPGLGVKVDLQEFGGVHVFTRDDVPIMKAELSRIVGNYGFIFKAHGTRAPRAEDIRDFRGPQYSRVLLTPEGVQWVNAETFAGQKENLLDDIEAAVPKVKSWNDTLISKGVMLRGTLSTLMHLALSNAKIAQAPLPKKAKGDKTPRPRRPAKYEYTEAMEAAFGGNTPAYYDYEVVPNLGAGKFEVEKVRNKGKDNLLTILEDRYSQKAKVVGVSAKTKAPLVKFSTQELIGPYAQSITGWITYEDNEKVNDRVKAVADLPAAVKQDVQDAFDSEVDDRGEVIPEVKAVHDQLIAEYNAVKTLKTDLSDAVEKKKKAEKSSKKQQRKIIRVRKQPAPAK